MSENTDYYEQNYSFYNDKCNKLCITALHVPDHFAEFNCKNHRCQSRETEDFWHTESSTWVYSRGGGGGVMWETHHPIKIDDIYNIVPYSNTFGQMKIIMFRIFE